MSKHTQNTLGLVGVMSAGLALTVFVFFTVTGDFSHLGGLLWGVIAGIIFGAILLVLAYRQPGASAKETLEQVKQTVTGGTTAAAAPVAAEPAPAPAPAPEPAATPAPEPVAEPVPLVSEPAAAEPTGEAKPAALDGPRGGQADDLKKIKGVGPKLEELLNSMGFYHFDQIAAWTGAEVAWVDDNLEGFKGRVTRDDWVAQAKLLASGGETDFSKKVDKGDVY